MPALAQHSKSTPADVIEGRADWCVVTGDCLEVMAEMPDRSVAHVITDPPYEADAHTQQRRQLRNASGMNQSRVKQICDAPLSFSPITETQRTTVSTLWARIATRWILAFCQAEAVGAWRLRLVDAGLDWKRSCVWIKPDGQPQLTGDRPGMGYESVAAAHVPGKSRWNAGGKHGIYTFPKNERGGLPNLHPTQKPGALMDALVRDFTDQGEIVLDPFCGSGTTGVACRRLGRRFIGIELNEKWADIARRRIGETHEQPDLLAAEAHRRVAKIKRKQMGLSLPESE
jgi:site-specific DNA-methyltransferase (adenine-specific)